MFYMKYATSRNEFQLAQTLLRPIVEVSSRRSVEQTPSFYSAAQITYEISGRCCDTYEDKERPLTEQCEAIGSLISNIPNLLSVGADTSCRASGWAKSVGNFGSADGRPHPSDWTVSLVNISNRKYLCELRTRKYLDALNSMQTILMYAQSDKEKGKNVVFLPQEVLSFLLYICMCN